MSNEDKAYIESLKKIIETCKLIGGIGLILIILILFPAIWFDGFTLKVLGKIEATILTIILLCYLIEKAGIRLLKDKGVHYE